MRTRTKEVTGTIRRNIFVSPVNIYVDWYSNGTQLEVHEDDDRQYYIECDMEYDKPDGFCHRYVHLDEAYCLEDVAVWLKNYVKTVKNLKMPRSSKYISGDFYTFAVLLKKIITNSRGVYLHEKSVNYYWNYERK